MKAVNNARQSRKNAKFARTSLLITFVFAILLIIAAVALYPIGRLGLVVKSATESSVISIKSSDYGITGNDVCKRNGYNSCSFVNIGKKITYYATTTGACVNIQSTSETNSMVGCSEMIAPLSRTSCTTQLAEGLQEPQKGDSIIEYYASSVVCAK